MYDCTVNATRTSCDLTAIIVGHCSVPVPEMVEREAARMVKEDIKEPVALLADDGRFLLLRPAEDPWLVGGENWRMLGQQIVAAVRAQKLRSVQILVEGELARVQDLIEGALLGDYFYDAQRSGEAGKREKVTVRVPGQGAAIKAAQQVAECQNLARELADGPANLVNPTTFISKARTALRGLGVKIKTVVGLDALRKAGFPGLVQVGQGGSVEPALLEISYDPPRARKSGPRLALVGKGITFDAGGISLKPGAKMWEMKGDMGGAAAMLGAIRLIALRKPKVPVRCYIALAENMPDSRAQRPGDIYQARNGKYVHVDNTDAEGRLVMADVLTYAGEQGATHMINAATLTGACLVALGNHIAGLMGRHEDWVQTVRDAGLDRGEEFWPLPLYGEYRKLLDHPHADLNNIGGRYGGTITAGLFLSEFVDEKIRWAHCDIAGPAIQTDGWRYYAKGMTGFGVRTFAAVAEGLG